MYRAICNKISVFPLIAAITFSILLFLPNPGFGHGGSAPGLIGDPDSVPNGAKIIRDKVGRIKYMEFDSDDDGKVDVWNYYENGKLIRQNADKNGDEKADIFIYLQQGNVIRVEADRDGDGFFELTEKYENGRLTLQTIDSDKNQKADITHIIENGIHLRTEVDTDFDGKTDSWTFFDADETPRLTMEDTDADGIPDKETRYDKEGKIILKDIPLENPVLDIPAEDDATLLDEVTVVEQRSLTAASDKIVRNRDFASFPRHNPSDLVRLIPSVHVSQHTGGAKAYQYFLRGFDAEHGQDLAAYLDGIPLNEPSQVHGHGYLDLHFLIPETISSIKIIKGPYDPEYGNFATAGAINFIPRRIADDNSVAATVGMFGFSKVQGAFGIDAQPYYLVGAIEGDHLDGYTDPGQADSFRANTGHTFLFGNWGLTLISNHYGQKSAATDVIPEKWVKDGKIDRFGSLDSTDKVISNRHLFGLTADLDNGPHNLRLQSFFDYKRTTIWSNYTFYLFNPKLGDQHEMFDSREVFGTNIRYMNTAKIGPTIWNSAIGIQWRYDKVLQILANSTNRERWNEINDLDFTENAAGIWFRENLFLTKWFSLVPGARFDFITYDGEGTQDQRYFNIYTNQADTRDDVFGSWNETASIFSPKVSAIFSPLSSWDIFLNYGEGFFSNTTLQMANDPKSRIPKVRGGELANRLNFWNQRVTTSGAAWYAEKEEDLVFDPQTGIASVKEKTIRKGLDGELRISPTRWLYILTDASYVDARFSVTGHKIPNGPIFLMTNGLGINHPIGLRGMILGRYMGKRELDQNDFAPPFYVVDMVVGFDTENWGVELAVDNLFNTKWEDAVFSYETRPEQNGPTYNGIHWTPGSPLFARFSVTAKF